MKGSMDKNYTILSAIAVSTTLVIITASFLIVPVDAKANRDHSNPVAPGANTNQPYMGECKEHLSAKDCATGPGNNGEFTSGIAHDYNGPK